MAVSDEINRVRFVAEDFQTYVNEARTFYQTNFPADFNNLIATDMGNALIDQNAFAMQALAFMVNRRASELFLSTARLTSSITKLARMLGYPIASAAPAVTSLNITLSKGPYPYPVVIPVGFQFKGPGSIVYEYSGASAFVIPVGITQVQIPIKEGQTRRVNFVSNGTENQSFNILGIPSTQFIYSDDLSVTVDGSLWTREDLIQYSSSNIYEVLFTESPPQLNFGDGIAGNVPPQSSQVVLTFRFGFGSAGSVGQNQISSVVTNLVINGVTIPMTFTNLVSDVGSDPEDIRHVRSFASSFFRTQNAAVIKQDYDTIAQLQAGVALADAQIIRGIDNDVIIQESFAAIQVGEAILLSAVSGIQSVSVSGIGSLGVSGTSSLSVSGTSSLGVSGTGSLFVGNVPSLGVSGTQFLGSDVSGNVTGIGFLGVSGTTGLFIGGIPQLGVSGLSALGVTNQSALGVSGIPSLGIAGQAGLVETGLSGVAVINDAVSGLAAYLSQAFCDTSQANQVQVIVLSADSNNRYISPPLSTLEDVQSTLRSLCDAVVTVNAVDGTAKLVNVDINVDLGISQTAVVSDVNQTTLNALISTTEPLGLLVKRSAGNSLYVSDIENAIQAANNAGDLRYINVTIVGPSQYLDSAGNMVIGKQQIIQNGTVNVTCKQRFLLNGDVVAVINQT